MSSERRPPRRMMSQWTHPICDDCWMEQNPYREPMRLKLVDEVEACCWCGKVTESGIYLRADPTTVPLHEEHEELWPSAGTDRRRR